MPVDLNTLPASIPLPEPLSMKRWVLIMLLCASLGGGLTVVLWSEKRWDFSAWFWCCAVLLPSLFGLMLFAIRQLIHEQRVDYAERWNDRRNQHERRMIEHGQRAIALLGASYEYEAGCTQLAKTLSEGLLHSPVADDETESKQPPRMHDRQCPDQKIAVAQRLSSCFEQLLASLDADLQKTVTQSSLQVRISHDGMLGADEIEELWRSCRGDVTVEDDVVFAADNDGLLWLDEWLDTAWPAGPLISLQINLLPAAVVGHAECVSFLLLAPAQWCVETGAKVQAWVHRPVKLSDDIADIQRALFWGNVPPDSPDFFIWHSQLPEGRIAHLSLELHAAGQSPASGDWHAVDDSLGSTGVAVGHTTLIIASEQAVTQGRPQLILLHEHSMQACVVQPA